MGQDFGIFPNWTWIVGFIIGAAIGSFLNVVIYRIPRMMSLAEPRHSFCPRCQTRLDLSDLVPLASWLMLGRRCRYCQNPIPSRYFFVELATGILWAGVWYKYFCVEGDVAKAILYFAAVSTLVVIIFIDLELYIIPDQINAFLWFCGICYNLYLFIIKSPQAMMWGMPSALAGWIVGTLSIWFVTFLGRVLFQKDAMGHGDIKMLRGVGTILMPTLTLMSLGVAIVLGAVLGTAQALIFNRKESAEQSEADDPSSDVEEVPETIGSLLKSGLGYLLCIDILGLFSPKLYESWFNEPAFESIEETEDFPVGWTQIPFGPYLALGAIVAVIFQKELLGLVDVYMNWAFPPAKG